MASIDIDQGSFGRCGKVVSDGWGMGAIIYATTSLISMNIALQHKEMIEESDFCDIHVAMHISGLRRCARRAWRITGAPIVLVMSVETAAGVARPDVQPPARSE